MNVRNQNNTVLSGGMEEDTKNSCQFTIIRVK